MGLQRRGIVLETLGGLLVCVQYLEVTVGIGRSTVFENFFQIDEGAPIVPIIIRESTATELRMPNFREWEER